MEYKRLDPKILQDAAKMLKSVAHPLRLRIIESLDIHRDMTVSELMKYLREEQVAVSKALGYLKKSGIVKSMVEGNTRVYRIAYPNVLNLLDCIRKHKKG